MPLIPVDTAVVIEMGPLVDDTDFKTLETAVAYDASGMSLDLIQGNASTLSKTDITPTSGGANDWTHKGNGVYELELTAAQNDTEGTLRVVGACDGVLPFESPVYTVVPTAVYNALVAGSDALEVDAVAVGGTSVAGPSDLKADVSGLSTFDASTDEVDVGRIKGTGVTGPSDLKADVSGLSTFDAATDEVSADVVKVEGQTLSAKTGDNFDAFFHNAGSDTAQTVDDVGGAGASTDWTDAEKLQIRKALGLTGSTGDTSGDGNLDSVLARLTSLLGVPVIADTAVTAATSDITRHRGDTVDIEFDLGRDITGASLKFTVKHRARDPQSAAIITKSSAETSEIEITDAENGTFVVKLETTDTTSLLPDGRQATFLYDVEMTLDGVVQTVVAGDFTLLPDISTP